MEIGGWIEKRDPIHVCFGKKKKKNNCGMRSTVLLDTSKSSWEGKIMNAPK